MPLPDEPFDLEGGCNCGAIRYRVSIPAKDSRPTYPGHGADVNPPVRMPISCTDHCNDCRTATGALLPSWLLTPMSMVTTSLVNTSTITSEDGRLAKETTRGPWIPASDIFCANTAPVDSTLKFFASSKGRRRSFCSRCGTMFAYQVFPKLDFLEFDMLDLVLGTVDREYLDTKDFLIPERQLWWKLGMKWLQNVTTGGLKAPVHADWSVATEANPGRIAEGWLQESSKD